MLLEKEITRPDGTVVILSIEGSHNVFSRGQQMDASYFARVKRPGQTTWEYRYPPTKGSAEMNQMSVAEYTTKGWGSVVKPSEVIKITSDFARLLSHPQP